MKIVVIPARGGSKRIPRKNVRLFAGKPMIAYAIAAAHTSELFDQVLVSTDDVEIAKIANEYGATTPFIRPTELADDHTPTVPVIADAILKCERLGWAIDHVCCIYPCVPFLQATDLRDGLKLLEASGAHYAFPIAPFPSAIQRALRLDADGFVTPFFESDELVRTQDLEPAYHDAGQFYWGSKEAWLTIDRIHAFGVGLTIPQWRAVDIDTPDDWHRAEIFFELLNKQAIQ